MNYTAKELSTRLLTIQIKELEGSLKHCMQRDRQAVRELIKEYRDELEKRAAAELAKTEQGDKT